MQAIHQPRRSIVGALSVSFISTTDALPEISPDESAVCARNRQSRPILISLLPNPPTKGPSKTAPLDGYARSLSDLSRISALSWYAQVGFSMKICRIKNVAAKLFSLYLLENTFNFSFFYFIALISVITCC